MRSLMIGMLPVACIMYSAAARSGVQALLVNVRLIDGLCQQALELQLLTKPHAFLLV